MVPNSSEHEKKIKKQQSWCECLQNIKKSMMLLTIAMFLPAEEEEVWSGANHDRDGKTVLGTRDAQEAERNCHLKYV